MSIDKSKLETDIEIHLIVCTNERPIKNKSCGQNGSLLIYRHFKDRMKLISERYGKRVKVNSSNCLSNCAQGPVVVCYPKGDWYNIKTKKDADALIVGLEKQWLNELRDNESKSLKSG